MTARTISINSCLLCDEPLNVADALSTQDFSYQTSTETFRFAECQSCMSWTQVSPPSNMENYYPVDYGNPGQKVRRSMNLAKSIKHKLLLSRVKRISSGRRLLDYGCGDAQFLRDSIALGFEVSGTDMNENLRLGVEKVGGTWINLQSLFDGTQIFDVITLFQTIEHVPNPFALVQNLRKHLTNEGILVIETPAPDGLDYELFERSLWGGFHAPRHYFVASKSALVEMFTVLDLEIVDHQYILSPYTWAETLSARFNQNKHPKRKKSGFSISNPVFLFVISILETILISVGRRTSNQRIIARMLTPYNHSSLGRT